MTAIEHLPGCNLEHEGGNFQWTCRNRLVVTRPGIGTAHPPEEVASVTVDADGPCTGNAAMAISVEARIVNTDELNGLWEDIQQAIAIQSAVMADWSQRSQCQHPEDEDCP